MAFQASVIAGFVKVHWWHGDGGNSTSNRPASSIRYWRFSRSDRLESRHQKV